MEKDQLFLSVLKENKGAISRLCSVYTNNKQDFEDLFQDVLLNLWNSLNSFQNKSSLSTWVYRVALNTCLNYKRDKSKTLKQASLNIAIKTIVDFTKSSEKALETKALYDCINTLKDIDKSIIVLYLEDLPYKEISKIVGISENHVSVKIKRIKILLKNCLKQKL